MTKEFEEVAHSGGTVTFKISQTEQGQAYYQVTIRSSRPVPATMIALYAMPPGVPVAAIKRLGWETPEPPPMPGALMVLISSDSHGLFGHQCPRCNGYWRSGPWPVFCPYCALNADSLNFLSEAQRRYIEHYCGVLAGAVAEGAAETVIDMDAVADAVSSKENRPAFFVAEESQQHKFNCHACGAVNDILGTYAYCSQCATRNDLPIFENETLPKLRERLNGGGAPEDCIRDAVAAMDSFVGQYAGQLAQLVPMVKPRSDRLTNRRFHDFDEVVGLFADWFGIDLLKGVKPAEAIFAKQMFHRRHVYEHKGGEADAKYIRDSGETGVRPKQRLRNTQQDAHELLGVLVRMGRNLHAGFHELLPPEPKPIEAWRER